MKAPTTPLARRIAALVKRRPTTPWSDRELKEYKKLYKAGCFDSPNDMDLVEQFYAFERRRGDDGHHRRDLLTLLNNFPGELDKAQAWRERHPIKPPPRKIIPIELPANRPPLSTEEQAEADRFMALYRERKQAREGA